MEKQLTLDVVALAELRKAVEELKRTLEQLDERLTKVEADASAGLHLIYVALEAAGLMKNGEPVQDSKREPTTGEAAKKEPIAVSEMTFTILKFEDKQGEKLGQYVLAFKKSNLSDKFQSAYNILRQSNATISKRYCGTGYAYSYWLYDSDDRIFRQKLKPKT